MKENNTGKQATTSDTRVSHPEHWQGPSILIWGFADPDCRLFVTGYYKKLILWEEHPEGSWSELLDGTNRVSEFAKEFLENCEHVLVEIDQSCGQSVMELLTKIGFPFVHRISSLFDGIKKYDYIPPTANKPSVAPDGWSLYDLAAINLPNQHFIGGKISYCSRRCRLAVSDRLTVCIWEPPLAEDIENWSPEQQRWPHHGIPGLEFQIYRDKKMPFGSFESVEQDNDLKLFAAMSIVERIIVNENYGLSFAFKNELETLQGEMFNVLHNPISRNLDDILSKLDILSRYLRKLRENYIRLTRRIDQTIGQTSLSAFLNQISSYGNSKDSLKCDLENLNSGIDAGQSRLLKLAKFIPALQNQVSAKFRQYASSFAILFSAATIIIAIYGDNIQKVALPDNSLTWLITGAFAIIFSLLAVFGVAFLNLFRKIMVKVSTFFRRRQSG